MRTHTTQRRPSTVRLIAGLVLLATAFSLIPLSQGAGASESLRTLSYHGEKFQVPASWPVFDLSSQPSTCVRFNRHAAYLGAPSAASRCPAQVFGASSAIEVEPITTARLSDAAKAEKMTTTSIGNQSVMLSTTSAVSGRIVAAFPEAGVLATLSFRTGVGEKAARAILDSFSFAATPPSASATSFSFEKNAANPPTTARAKLEAATTQTADVGSVVYSGEGFDTCEAPSESQMAAWRTSSPFQAVGVYIGGINAACHNVTSTWIADEAAAGWATFPIYVGLQAPCAYQSNLASISKTASTAASEGANDAQDAVNEATSLGIAPGSTIYDDMEAWNTGFGTCNTAVLSYLEGWTNTLHAAGFKSGVYASLYSGVSVIESIYGQSDAPDVIYFAYWDGVATTTESTIPSTDWAAHQRIKQYATGNWTYGGVQLNIDEDFLDAPAVGSAGPTVTSLAPATAPAGARVTINGSNLNQGTPVVHFGTAVSPHVSVLSASKLVAVVPTSTTPTAPVTVSTTLGTSPAIAASTFTYTTVAAIASEGSGYLLASKAGNVMNYKATFYGSVGGRSPNPVVGIATTSTGYLLATSAGNVFNYGTPWYGSLAGRSLPAPVVGIATTSTGYLLVTAKGNVYAFHTRWLGSLARRSLPAPVVGIATTSTGYLLVTAKGNVYGFHTRWEGSTGHQTIPAPIVGMATTTSGGYVLASSAGDVYNFNTPSYGSETGKTLPAPVVGVTATSAGYILVTAAGNVFNFNTPFYSSPAALAR